MANNIIKDREQLRAKLQGAALIALADTKNGSSKIMVEPLEYESIFNKAKDKVGKNLILSFGRKEEDRTVSGLIFSIEKLRLLNSKRFVIEGTAISSRHTVQKKIKIDYQFDTQEFYEAILRKNGQVRDMRLLNLDFAGELGQKNVSIVCDLIHYLALTIYSINL